MFRILYSYPHILRNMRAILCTFVLSACLLTYVVVVIGKPPPQEGLRCYKTNEEYTECGSACEKTCDTVQQTKETFYCPALCVPGCFCIEGHVRNRWGNCIPKENCPCHKDDEVFICGPVCQRTCENLNQNCAERDKCVCQCRDGYVRDKSGGCLPIELCPGYNDIY